jgi:hypothetical protein
MPILVDPTLTFPVRVKYRDVFDRNAIPVGIRILPDDAEGEGVHIFEVQAIGRGGDYVSRVMEECTYFNHVTGKPVVRMRLFCYAVFRHFFKKWNLADADSGDPLPMTDQILMWLDWRIVRATVKQWLKITDGRI